jgi:alpha-glucosidase
MPWDDAPNHGFTTGTPWLPVVDHDTQNVAAQEADPDSTLNLVRRLIRLRHDLAPELRFRDSPQNTVVLERGEHLAAINLGDDPAPLTRPGQLVLEARPGDGADPRLLPPHGGWIARN